MALGLGVDGTLQVPPRGFPAGWFTGAPTPGELGPAIMVGHVDMNGPGVFFQLHNLEPGDRVVVTRADGSKPVFRVSRVDRFPKDKFPTSLVYGNLDHPGLRLITCGGSFNSATGHYDDNFVAFLDTRPVFKGHVLLIPREHVVTLPDLPAGLRDGFLAAAQRIATAVVEALGAQGSFVAINNTVSQSVPHLHLHVVPRTKGDGLRGFFWPRTTYADQEAGQYAERLRAALE